MGLRDATSPASRLRLHRTLHHNIPGCNPGPCLFQSIGGRPAALLSGCRPSCSSGLLALCLMLEMKLADRQNSSACRPKGPHRHLRRGQGRPGPKPWETGWKQQSALKRALNWKPMLRPSDHPRRSRCPPQGSQDSQRVPRVPWFFIPTKGLNVVAMSVDRRKGWIWPRVAFAAVSADRLSPSRRTN